MPQKNYLPGGIIMCVFSAMVYWLARLNGGDNLDFPILVFLALMFYSGLAAVVMSLFRLDPDGPAYWFMGSVFALGFSVMAFGVTWYWKEGWSGLPVVPDAWNAIIARSAFALGGLVGIISTVVFFRKALNRLRRNINPAE